MLLQNDEKKRYLFFNKKKKFYLGNPISWLLRHFPIQISERSPSGELGDFRHTSAGIIANDACYRKWERWRTPEAFRTRVTPYEGARRMSGHSGRYQAVSWLVPFNWIGHPFIQITALFEERYECPINILLNWYKFPL